MDKLYVILVNDNVIRSTLADLRRAAGADLWLVASPHYARKLPGGHRAVFSRILVQEDFGSRELAERLERELPAPLPADLKFLTNDESCELACAELADHFGRPLWQATTMMPFVNKMASKAKLAARGLRLPRHLQFDRARLAAEGRAYCQWIAEQIGFPMIVKPVDRYASMDVRRIDSMPALRAWASWACSPKDRNTYEIDEFIRGTLYNCDSLVRNGQVIWSSVCRNANPCMEFALGRSLGVYTVTANDAAAARVREFSATVLAALSPPDGGVHMEIFLTPAGELVFLEAAARPPGGELRDIYLRCHGLDIDLAHYLLRAREPYELKAGWTGCYGGWYILPRRRGTVSAIDLPALRSEHTVDLRVAVGDVIERDSAHIVEPPSAIFMIFSTDAAEFERDMEVMRELQLYRVDG